MEIVSGRQEVWKHAGEAGMQEDIRLISKYFDIKDISIIYNGKMSYIIDRPRPTHRICVATRGGMSINDRLKVSREKAKKR